MIFLLITPSFWIILNKPSILWSSLLKKLHAEFSLILSPSSPIGVTPLVVSVFIFIIRSNLLGLSPYTFTTTSHMTLCISLSLPVWAGLIAYGWSKTPTHILAHLIPQSTPPILIPFIVLIESTRNIIRPATLAIRLTANIIAGHLLITLLGSQVAANKSIIIEPIVISLPIILTSLELAVALIQSYVFTVLITLYASEVSYDN